MRDRIRARRGVAKTEDPAMCWAEVHINLGPNWPRITGCRNKVRRGFLTCVKHANREAAAQSLYLGRSPNSPTRPHQTPNPNMNRLGAIALALMLAGAPAVAGQFSINPDDWDRYH